MSHLLQEKALSVDDVLLVPKEGILNSRSQAQLKTFLCSAPMDTVTGYEMVKAMLAHDELAVVSRFLPEEERDKCIKEFAGNPRVYFAVGFKDYESTLNKTSQQINIALDIAHGDMTLLHKLTEKLAESDLVDRIMSGSICTWQAALRAIEAGCTDLRVGVGPGAACTTRLMTGCGYPNLSAVYQIAQRTEKYSGVTVIADGGVKHPGDAVKYMSAGAHAVMMGSAFSRTKESAGWKEVDGKLIKSYRGQASAAFQVDQFGSSNRCPEGASSSSYAWDGLTVSDVIGKYHGGMQSALSYLGLSSTDQLHPDNVEFVQITAATYIEGTPHGT